MNDRLLNYVDVGYVVKLILVFTSLYYFNIVYWGLTDPLNQYSYVLDHYLNYISWFQQSILYTAHLLTRLAGLLTFVDPPQLIRTASGASVIISFECLGLGVSSFWTAYVIANSGTWQKKSAWLLGGIALIWFVNCCRIALLLFALDKNWPESHYIDHHDLFNVAAYVIILTLMYFHSRQPSRKISLE
ncbi:exosortase/archaeosortase family protein [Spirosoma pulveris]